MVERNVATSYSSPFPIPVGIWWRKADGEGEITGRRSSAFRHEAGSKINKKPPVPSPIGFHSQPPLPRLLSQTARVCFCCLSHHQLSLFFTSAPIFTIPAIIYTCNHLATGFFWQLEPQTKRCSLKSTKSTFFVILFSLNRLENTCFIAGQIE